MPYYLRYYNSFENILFIFSIFVQYKLMHNFDGAASMYVVWESFAMCMFWFLRGSTCVFSMCVLFLINLNQKWCPDCGVFQLPKIAVDGESIDMYNDMGRGRFNSFGSPRGFGDGGRYGGQGNYGSGQGFRNSGFGRSDGQFSGSSRNGYNRNQSGNFGRSSNFGEPRTDRSSNFGDFGSGRSSNFGDFGSGRSSSFGDFGSGRSSSFGDSGSGRSSSFGDNSGLTNRSQNDYHFRQSAGFGDSRK
jgi:hypothetical protein